MGREMFGAKLADRKRESLFFYIDKEGGTPEGRGKSLPPRHESGNLPL